MKKQRLLIRTIILLLLASALGYTLYSNFFVSKEKIVVGDLAPDFVLTDLNGEKHRLSDYRGQGVFLNFWGTWCKPCEKEMPYMENQYKIYKDQGVQILAVNVGEPVFSVSKFVEKYGLSFPVVIDKGNQVLNAYGVDPLPTTFLVDKEGKIVEIITGTLTERMVQEKMELIKP
ncbi:thiol-disulfide oxidoreductase ResA [Cytobacillus sp. S13-E01]|uniref:thiol-disulfide oxidoreductase ResA n=1 Tax=Cytobacillus sp. S13-E01 TaxID=3031326 RepID=UPI0023D83994|nr:thiol-disulfide oxidoreductase ResA [Cytobacillus sp. S13-E01]MDF0726173.1 thiol-disulfide oxidoreductase ResA [Cytobacillus sp. S13-E01]